MAKKKKEEKEEKDTIRNPFTKASDGNAADVVSFYDTGSYILNAAVSGSIYGGIASNKITAFAGTEGVGKTFYILNIVENFFKKHPNGNVYCFETEFSITNDQLEQRNIPLDRFHIAHPTTVQEFRTDIIHLVDNYLAEPVKNRDPAIVILDSLGNLSTIKEIEDSSEEGNNTTDMTRAKNFKGVFRIITNKLGVAGIPLLVTNHTYDEQGTMYPKKIMSGGSGLKYAASTILFFSKSKAKEKDPTTKKDVLKGWYISVTTNKSRFTVDGKLVDTLLDHEDGINRYYGLLEIAEKYKIIKKISGKFVFPGKESKSEKEIYDNPEEYFTKEILININTACGEEFKYGSAKDPSVEMKDDGLD